jgi:hypothetical protein
VEVIVTVGSLSEFEDRETRQSLCLWYLRNFRVQLHFMSAVPFHVIFFVLLSYKLLGLGDLLSSASLGESMIEIHGVHGVHGVTRF